MKFMVSLQEGLYTIHIPEKDRMLTFESITLLKEYIDHLIDEGAQEYERLREVS